MNNGGKIIPDYYASLLRANMKNYSDGLLVPKTVAAWLDPILQEVAKDIADQLIDDNACSHRRAQPNPCFDRVPCPDCRELVKR